MHILWRLPDSIRRAVENVMPNKSTDDSMGLLADGNAKSHTNGIFTSRQSRRLWKPIGIIGLIIACGFMLSSTRSTTDVEPPASNLHPISQEDHYLHVLLPTRLGPRDSCRTIISGAALNYPIPWAISWHADVDENSRDIGGDLGKLESILAFLEIQGPERNDDTVIVLANPNSWFQARPEVLLKRYRSIQKEHLHQALRQNASREQYELENLKQTIVLSAEKECLSKKGADCLPVQAEDTTPRFVSHNFVLGPVKELRLLYRDAVEEAKGLESHNSAFDEHSVFARLVSNQQHVNSAPWGYSIALDLVDRLSFAATSDESYAEKATPSTRKGQHFLAHKGRPRLTEDILTSKPPFHFIPDNIPKKWSDLSLLIPKKAVTVPAVVQQAAEFGPDLSQTWYERLWFHPHGRKFVETYAVNTSIPIASFVDADRHEQRFYSPHNEELGALAANGELHLWSEICEGEDYTASLFVDGLGT